MILNKDAYHNVTAPSYILCKPNNDRLGSLLCTEKKMTKKLEEYDEISFTTYLYNDNIRNELYDSIKELMYIELPDIGRYIINQIDVNSESTKYEYKQCTALSAEVTLAQKYLEEFIINMGTTGSIDEVSFYNADNPSKSLMHLVLEKCPDWRIGTIDSDLIDKQRSFEITRQDVYSFLTEDVADVLECIFVFDTLNFLINVYKKDSIGEDTNIYISYNNLAKNISISSSIDEIKTCLTVLGADDINIREVNMGYDRIYDLEYFHNLDYMSQGLYDAYGSWRAVWDSKVDEYEDLVVQYQDYYRQIIYKESGMMPDDPESTNWTEYGLIPLQSQLSAYEQTQSVMIKSGLANMTHPQYYSLYLPCYNAIQAIKAEITVREGEIEVLKNAQAVIGEQMGEIIELVSIDNNFTEAQRNELTKFIREEELSSDNFVVTDIMDDVERMDVLHELLEHGKNELNKIAQPALEFSLDMANIYAIPEFNVISDKFDVGNYIRCGLRDDYIVKLRIMTMDIDFYDESGFSVTFGNIRKLRNANIFEDVTSALVKAKNAATSVTFNSPDWNKAKQESGEISNILTTGILPNGLQMNTTTSDVVIDDRGITVTDTDGNAIILGGGQILISDDNLKTISTAIGMIEYTDEDGTTHTSFGTSASSVNNGRVTNSLVSNNAIVGGTMNGTSITDVTVGDSDINNSDITGGTIKNTDINNGNGKFHIDTSGNGTVGGININASGTYGNFNRGISIDSSFELKNGALNDLMDMIGNNIEMTGVFEAISDEELLQIFADVGLT